MLNSNFSKYSLVDLKDSIKLDDIKIPNAKVANVSIYIEGETTYPLEISEYEDISYEVTLLDNLVAPLKAGEKVGEIKIYLNNCLLFSRNLCTIDAVEKKSIFDIIKDNLS